MARQILQYIWILAHLGITANRFILNHVEIPKLDIFVSTAGNETALIRSNLERIDGTVVRFDGF